jgi:hypothetical protein
VIACLLYAFHPRLIQMSPELIRDPTFWFLLTLTLYLAWRAISEVRWLFFVLGGLSYGLAFLTRLEGLFLAIPIVLWSIHRAAASSEGRRRVLLGGATMLALFPAILVVVNLVLLRDNPRWELIRTRPLELVVVWLGSLGGRQPDLAIGLPETFARMDFGSLLWLFLHMGEVGLTPCFALLMFGGLWAWRRIWLRRDQQPLFYVSLAIAAGIWIHLWCSQTSNYRYLFPIVIMGSPFAALGLLSLGAWLGRLTARENVLRGAIAASAFLIVSGIGIAGALTGNCGFRQAEPRLGQWIQNRYGPHPVLLGSEGVTPVIGYYAAAQYHLVSSAAPDEAILAGSEAYAPDVILLLLSNRMRRAGSEQYNELVERLHAKGFERASDDALPKGCERLLVLTRTTSLPASAPAP